ncbi:MAG: hypothetical protein OEY43_06085 [Gammaproteobacteria bacterium]|nr:hypothetical protein [Gammaproteobacteria bacterium]
MEPSFSDPNIPTLTDIIEPGNEDMLNHFDASYFDDGEGAEEVIDDIGEILDTVIDDNEPADDARDDEMPTGQLDDEAVIAAENLTDMLDDIVEAALDETLANFRQELKQQLTATILQKLEEKSQ